MNAICICIPVLVLTGALPANAASADCDARFPANNIKVAVARMQCFNAVVLETEAPEFGNNGDLLAKFLAERMVIAEQVQTGKITVIQGKAIAAEKWSEVISELQRRDNAADAVQGQRAAAQAQADALQAAQRQQACAEATQAYNQAASQPVPSGSSGNVTAVSPWGAAAGVLQQTAARSRMNEACGY